MTQHPTPSQNAPNRGPNLGRWLFAGFTMVSLSPLLYRPAFADTTIWTKASDRQRAHRKILAPSAYHDTDTGDGICGIGIRTA